MLERKIAKKKYSKQSYNYSGFKELNYNEENFERYVMSPDEMMMFFAESGKFEAPYIYPEVVARGFEEPPIFSKMAADKNGFTLQAEIVTIQHPTTCLTWFAKQILPEVYTAIDRLQYAEKKWEGFGIGTCRITTLDCHRPDGSPAKLAKKLIAVENRPALFLKVRDSSDNKNGFYSHICLFFPGHVEGYTHKAVRNGEVFVLVRQDIQLTNKMLIDINATFNLLVNRSFYQNGNQLYSTADHTSLEDFVTILTSPRRSID